MQVALIHARPGADSSTDEHARRVAAHLVARGDALTCFANAACEPPAPGVAVEVLKPFALSAAGRAKAFDAAVEARCAQGGFDAVYSLGRTSSASVLRLSEGVRETRIELAKDAELARSSEEQTWAALEARGMQRGRSRLVAVPSELVGKDAMKRHHVLPELIRLVRPGVDLARFSPQVRERERPAARLALRLEAPAFVVAFQADGWALHGLDRLLKVWDAVAASRAAARLVIAGSDAGRAAHEKLVAGSRLKDVVRFLPEGTSLERVLHAADLFVLPTRYDACSRAGLAALASGLPVVTTATNGLAELIDEDVNGIALFGDDVRQTLYQQLLSWTKPERAQSARDAARAAAERCPLEAEARAAAEAIDEAAAAR
ncbi:MAG: glycosyltransferase family 4 protein [Planctomycetes bacterium]|nr:glycosyltransferase family 4 protein [Planctomycetota bacterium]